MPSFNNTPDAATKNMEALVRLESHKMTLNS